jgi:hypothetical protein
MTIEELIKHAEDEVLTCINEGRTDELDYWQGYIRGVYAARSVMSDGQHTSEG